MERRGKSGEELDEGAGKEIRQGQMRKGDIDSRLKQDLFLSYLVGAEMFLEVEVLCLSDSLPFTPFVSFSASASIFN